MKALDFRRLFKPSQDLQYAPQNLTNQVSDLREAISDAAGLSFDWNDADALRALKEKDLLSIRDAASGPASQFLTETLQPQIHEVVGVLFGDPTRYPIRVSPQVKRCWTEDDLQNDSRIDSQYANFAFPTRAHQDLINNGCRSSHTLIFYYHLTPPFDGCNMMEVATDTRPVGLYGTTDAFGYVNEILAEEQHSLDWKVPDYSPDTVYMMTGMKAHRSDRISRIPRIALNVKLQPQDLTYLELVYGQTVADLTDAANPLSWLSGILEDLCSQNHGLHFELAVTRALNGDEDGAWQAVRSLFVSLPPTAEELRRLLYGAFLRKIITREEPIDYCDYPLTVGSVVPHSCAAAILETINKLR